MVLCERVLRDRPFFSLTTFIMETSHTEAGAGMEEVIINICAELAESPCAVVMADLEAACAVNERPNMPTSDRKYPNWSLVLPCSLDQLEAADLPDKLAQILNRRHAEHIGVSPEPC